MEKLVGFFCVDYISVVNRTVIHKLEQRLYVLEVLMRTVIVQ